MKKVLVTGGAGYKGTLLVDALLGRGCAVTLMDNFMFGDDPALFFAGRPDCRIVKKDVRTLTRPDVAGYDIIYHLAGISGYPACEANPHAAQTINVDSTRNLANLMDEGQILVYASTTSIYGQSGELQDEDSRPTPVSLYGITKYEAEKISLRRKNSVSFRFATLFGVSLKMRCDLMLNDFVFKAVTERNLVLFDELSVRTFLHVRDAVAAYLMVLDKADALVGKVFNVGSEDMNYSKLELAQRIRSHVKMELIKSSLEDIDRRDFIINFNRIKALGFQKTVDLDGGIRELVELYEWYRPYKPFHVV